MDILRCAYRWVRWSLIFEHKTERKAISFELLVCFDTERETFFSKIFTGDETWVHPFEPERKQSNPWNGTILDLPGRKNSKSFHQWARSVSLSSGPVKEQFLRMHC